jgi:hypothetical protein
MITDDIADKFHPFSFGFPSLSTSELSSSISKFSSYTVPSTQEFYNSFPLEVSPTQFPSSAD